MALPGNLREGVAKLQDPEGEVYIVQSVRRDRIWLTPLNPQKPDIVVNRDDVAAWSHSQTLTDVTRQCSLIYHQPTKRYVLKHGLVDVDNDLVNYEVVGMNVFLKS